MSKSKLIFRSLLLMAILWAVNTLVQQWPVHVATSPPPRTEAKPLHPLKAPKDAATLQHGQVRTVPVD